MKTLKEIIKSEKLDKSNKDKLVNKIEMDEIKKIIDTREYKI